MSKVNRSFLKNISAGFQEMNGKAAWPVAYMKLKQQIISPIGSQSLGLFHKVMTADIYSSFCLRGRLPRLWVWKIIFQEMLWEWWREPNTRNNLLLLGPITTARVWVGWFR